MKKILGWDEFINEKQNMNDDPKTPKGDTNTPAGCDVLKKSSKIKKIKNEDYNGKK